jgi:hypothetical protein
MNVSPRLLLMRLCTVALLLGAGTMLDAAPPADRLSGQWEAEMTGDGKTFSFDFDFKATGTVLTGTLELSTIDRTFPIKDGKINGNNISFEGFGRWTGTLNGPELTLTRELDYGKKQHMKAHRKQGE